MDTKYEMTGVGVGDVSDHSLTNTNCQTAHSQPLARLCYGVPAINTLLIINAQLYATR